MGGGGGAEHVTSPVSTARILIITQFSLVRTLGRDSCLRTMSWARDEARIFMIRIPVLVCEEVVNFIPLAR